jgi:cell division protein FtsB
MASLETFAATIQALEAEMMDLQSRLDEQIDHRTAVKATIAELQAEQQASAAEFAQLTAEVAALECQVEDQQCLSEGPVPEVIAQDQAQVSHTS